MIILCLLMTYYTGEITTADAKFSCQFWHLSDNCPMSFAKIRLKVYAHSEGEFYVKKNS